MVEGREVCNYLPKLINAEFWTFYFNFDLVVGDEQEQDVKDESCKGLGSISYPPRSIIQA